MKADTVGKAIAIALFVIIVASSVCFVFTYDDDSDEFYQSEKIEFTQIGDSLDGTIKVDIKQLGLDKDAGNVKYSITRSDFDVALDADLDPSGTISVSVPFHGRYTLELKFTSGGTAQTEKMSIDFSASHYNFIITNATLPVTMSMTKAFIDENGYTYVRLERGATFEWSELPYDIRPFPTQYQDRTGTITTGQRWLSPGESVIMIAYVKELCMLNPDATFAWSISENYSRWSYGTLLAAGVPVDQMTINIYADGVNWSSSFVGQGMYNQTTYETQVAATKARIDDIIAKVQDGIDQSFGYTEDWKDTWVLGEVLPEYGISVNYYCFEVTKNAVMKRIDSLPDGEWKTKLLDLMSTYVVGGDLSERYDTLSAIPDRLQYYERTFRLAWDEGGVEVHFTADSSNPALIILGTAPGPPLSGMGETSAEMGGGTFREYMEWAVATYGSTHTIYYKGHPGWPVDPNNAYFKDEFGPGVTRLDWFEANGVIILPYPTPAEVYFFVSDDVYGGGYWSSTFNSVDPPNVLFAFGTVAYIQGIAGANYEVFISAGMLIVNKPYLDSL
ncbi:MAG: hypothetical protein LBV13_06155 [Methanomassiliicoccaceae archaeon]|jgi:hypothetical protein|nr:hypothetical protein [Methanomassiliicoccaceae archaeon]